MSNDIIKIGIPSKGRLRSGVLKIFKKKKLKILSERGERDLFGFIKGKKNIVINYLHAREIIERLADGSLDIGFSGYDLLMESEINVQRKVIVKKRYDFGKATLVVAIPDDWIDVQTMPDLEEIAFEFKDKKRNRLRIATKYPKLTTEFMFSRGVTQFKLVKSLGATEIYPFTGSSEIITDITSTGATLKAFKVAPVEVISVIISDDPVNGYISVAPRLLTNLNCVTPLENINSVVNFGYFVAIRNLFLFLSLNSNAISSRSGIVCTSIQSSGIATTSVAFPKSYLFLTITFLWTLISLSINKSYPEKPISRDPSARRSIISLACR